MGKYLAKYDVRGIQAFVFRTNKLKEIRAVSDLPERIIKDAAIYALKKLEINKKIEWLDTAGGNAVAVFDSKEEFEAVSTTMAFYVLKETYSLKLVYACIELDENKAFSVQYEELNEKLGKLKSEMPEPAHTGAFPICRQDYLTGFPIAKIEHKEKTTFLTRESVKKLNEREKKKADPDVYLQLDDMVLEKGVDSHIAVIHIDGNNMGNRINQIIGDNAEFDSDGGFEKIKDTFKSITVAQEFKKVCLEVKEIIEKYKEKIIEEKKATETYEGEEDKANANAPLIYSVIAAGDDITYVTRANIALPFTKLFLKKISEHNMYSDSEDHDTYGINACAGIAFIKSHFPFSDAYDLAEKCCTSAKKRAKSEGFADKDNSYGNWIDFEICTHIKNTELETSREKYGNTTDTEGNDALLHLRPYCVSTGNKSNEFFEYDKFEKRVCELDKNFNEQSGTYNRSRAKTLRQVYTEGKASVRTFEKSAESRGYKLKDKLFEKDETTGKTYALYYDATDIMDLIDHKFMDYVNKIIDGGGDSDEQV